MRSRVLSLLLVIPTVVAVASCAPAADEGQQQPPTADTAAASDTAAMDTSVVDITAKEFEFNGPAKIASGWTTLRFHNAGEQPHFLVLWRLTGGKTFDDYVTGVAQAFTKPVTDYRAGTVDREGMIAELGAALPDWYATDVDGWGGVAFVSPGHTGETTVHLEPGNYVMECYAQTPEGEFHGARGMLRPLIVTEEDTGASEPVADVEMTLSNYTIDAPDQLTPGAHTVAVTVTEEPEGLVGHDAHLVRMDENTDLQKVAAWMDWIDAMRSPAPAEFLGGADEIPAGHTAYVTIDLEPGRYAWISEGYASRGMIHEFTVAEGS